MENVIDYSNDSSKESAKLWKSTSTIDFGDFPPVIYIKRLLVHAGLVLFHAPLMPQGSEPIVKKPK